MRRLTILAGATLALLLIGCALRPVPGGVETGRGTLRFEAEGKSVVARSDDPLSLLEARLAAATIAKANLLEKVQGAYVMGEVNVDDLMFREQEAVAVVEGFLPRVEVTQVAQEASTEGSVVTAVASVELTRRELRRLAEREDKRDDQ